MKRFLLFAFAALAASFGYSQSHETRNLSHFDEISVGSAVEVILKKGQEEKAELSVSGTSPENVITEVSGSELKIHMRSGNYHHVDATVYVTYRSLESISISSASKVTADDPIQSDKMEIDVSSAGRGSINLDVKSLEVDISSAGNLDVKGQTQKQEVEISSAGGYEAQDLNCDNSEVRVSSAGHARINANKYLDAEASSGGSIRYRGNPDKEYTTENSGGSVRKVD